MKEAPRGPQMLMPALLIPAEESEGSIEVDPGIGGAIGGVEFTQIGQGLL